MSTKTEPKRILDMIEGYSVILDHQKRFQAFGKDIAEDKALYDPTFAGIKEKIHEHIKKLEASTRKTHKLALPVITDLGIKTVVTGIHARLRTLNGVKDDQAKDALYPDVPWIVGLVEERRKMIERAEAIRKRLYPYRIAPKVDGWGEMSAVVYEQSINALKQEYAEALIAAQKVEAEMPTHQGGQPVINDVRGRK